MFKSYVLFDSANQPKSFAFTYNKELPAADDNNLKNIQKNHLHKIM